MAAENSSSVVFRRFKVFSSKKMLPPTKQHSDDIPQEHLKKYWLVESAPKGMLTIRAIDAEKWLPVGSTQPITVRELQQRYTPENGLYERKVQPNLEKFSGNLSLLEVPEEAGVSAVDEAAFVTDFEKGLGCLTQGERGKAFAIFSDLLNADVPFEEKHKHLFNTCAIQLRKNKLSNQAIAYYTRALELAWGEDENLHINLARVLFEEKQYGGCVQHLFDALRLTPDNSVARSFLSWLHMQGLIPKQHALEARSFLGQRRPEDLLGGAQEEDSAQEPREASSRESGEGADRAGAGGCNTTLDDGSMQ